MNKLASNALLVTLCFCLVLIVAASAFAADTGSSTDANPWPTYAPEELERGSGFYLSPTKILLCWLVFLAWVRTTDWISRDAFDHRFNYRAWNVATFAPFVVAMVLVWLIALFWVSFPLLLLAYFTPLGLYIRYRNARVPAHEHVLTPDHLRYASSRMLRPFGVKVQEAKIDPRDAGPPVTLSHLGGDEREGRANVLRARQSPAFIVVQELLADAILRRAGAVMIETTDVLTDVRLDIDGVWHPFEPDEGASGTSTVEVFRTLAGLPENSDGQKEHGRFGVEYQGVKYTATLAVAATKTGRRAVVLLDDGQMKFDSLEALGMRQPIREKLEQLLGAKRGLVIFSALPQGGLTTTLFVALSNTDRLMREFIAVEDADWPEPEVENVPVKARYRSSAGETPAKLLPDLILTYPDVLVVTHLADTQTATILAQQVEENRLVITTIRAKDASESLLRVLLTKAKPALIVRAITAAVGQRLVRKLCDACKQPYEPLDDELKKIGIPPGKLSTLYRPPAPPPKPKDICTQCGGIGYFGRTAIFELLLVDDEVRKVLVQEPKIDLVRAAARKAKMRTLAEEGVRLVAEGVTSIEELTRAMKLTM
ncbi:MAG: ATPase, T2SS/T4P/T4SS family [Pirellulales bacterium]